MRWQQTHDRGNSRSRDVEMLVGLPPSRCAGETAQCKDRAGARLAAAPLKRVCRKMCLRVALGRSGEVCRRSSSPRRDAENPASTWGCKAEDATVGQCEGDCAVQRPRLSQACCNAPRRKSRDVPTSCPRPIGWVSAPLHLASSRCGEPPFVPSACGVYPGAQRAGVTCSARSIPPKRKSAPWATRLSAVYAAPGTKNQETPCLPDKEIIT